MTTSTRRTLGLALALMTPISALAQAPDTRVFVGPVYRGGMKFDAAGTSYSQQLGLQGAEAYRFTPDALPAVDSSDDLSSFADRSFEDGFVNVSSGTDGFLGGRTWYWGYQNDSQYDAGLDTLTFQLPFGAMSSEGYTHVSVNTVQNIDMKMDATLSGWGIETGVETTLFKGDCGAVAAFLCVAVIPDIDFHGVASTYEQHITECRGVVEQASMESWEYTYDTTGIIPPAAPYEGSTFAGPGVTIPNRPEDRRFIGGDTYRNSYETDRETYRAYNRIDIDFNMDLYSLRAGPRVTAKAADGIDVFLAGQASLHLANVSAARSESWIVDRGGIQTPSASWRDEADRQFVRVGIGADAGVNLRIGKSGFLRVRGGYDLVPEAVEMDVGPSRMSVDLSAWSAGAEIGWTW